MSYPTPDLTIKDGATINEGLTYKAFAKAGNAKPDMCILVLRSANNYIGALHKVERDAVARQYIDEVKKYLIHWGVEIENFGIGVIKSKPGAEYTPDIHLGDAIVRGSKSPDIHGGGWKNLDTKNHGGGTRRGSKKAMKKDVEKLITRMYEGDWSRGRIVTELRQLFA